MESLLSIVDKVYEQRLADDSSANTTILWGQTFMMDGKLQVKHAPAAKKVT